MRQHKAATAVTIAATTEKSGLALWVDRYWKVGAVTVLAIVGWIVYQAQARSSRHAVGEQGWAKLLAVAPQDPQTGLLGGVPDDLKRVAGEIEATPAGPWALYLVATTAVANREFDKASEAIAELKRKYPTHPTVALALSPGDTGSAQTAVARLEATIQAQRKFEQDRPDIFGNPELPADAPKVRLTTDHGVIVVGLYSNLAPKLAENFLKEVRAGAYLNTKFHAVVNGQYIRGGDPNTASGESSTWGKGGPGYTLEQEPTKLRNFVGTLSAAPDATDTKKLSGSQFLITSADAHGLDDTYVPFGRVIEGLDVVRTIGKLPLVEKSFTQPQNPAVVVNAEVL
ncbi:MAG TPA: peptidylprolyl isomerase [Planctomycetota bacterium]|jgi:peptidyl-prolyl cis-trans isomerase A (cyclophilin A)|nr:peptidylprolyl isomerase [Planctomycetota bacterium]